MTFIPQDPKFYLFSDSPVNHEAVNWLEKKLRSVDQVRRLKRFGLKPGGFRTPWRWTLRAPARGRRIVKAGAVMTQPGRKYYELSAMWSTDIWNCFPALVILPTATIQQTAQEKVFTAIEGGGKTWEYVNEELRIEDAMEMSVLIGAMPLWAYLRKTRQVEGRLTNPGINKGAVGWLKEFRLDRQRTKAAVKPIDIRT